MATLAVFLFFLFVSVLFFHVVKGALNVKVTTMGWRRPGCIHGGIIRTGFGTGSMLARQFLSSGHLKYYTRKAFSAFHHNTKRNVCKMSDSMTFDL